MGDGAELEDICVYPCEGFLLSSVDRAAFLALLLISAPLTQQWLNQGLVEWEWLPEGNEQVVEFGRCNIEQGHYHSDCGNHK